MKGFSAEEIGMLRWKSESSLHGLEDYSCSKSSTEDGLECPVCWEGFNTSSQLPYVLWCGHSLCRSCLLGLQWATLKLPVVPLQLPLLIACPWCQFLSCRLVWGGKLKYPCKNFFLLWLVESMRGDASYIDDGMKAESACPDAPEETHHKVSTCSFLGQTRPEAQSESFFWKRLFKNFAGVCASVVTKFILLLLVMSILFFVLPFSGLVLMTYFMATLVFAFPAFLVVYFAFPSLSWLLREIVT